MSKEQGKSRKPLIVGIIAAVVVLAVLLVVLLTQCNSTATDPTGGSTVAPTAAPTTTTVGEEAGDETYELYWNLDRALYDGKSEAGMSSRQPAEDGYFYVRLFHDGEVVEVRVADRKTINALDVRDLMGLEFDEDGVVVGVIPIDELPCEMMAWQFYVQSAGGKLIKTNSSASLNGMEILLETNENTGIWDMTGLSGEVGCEADPIGYDRLLAIGNKKGEVTHIFIYERSNYMRTHEAECEHCGKVVEWSEWTKENAIPTASGHYQLMNDVTTTGQTNMVEDAKICLDLNGKRIDGKSNARVYSLHNVGTELAIMDTSEEQTGTIAAHGKGDQGMCVWLRYGVVYLYGGTLDGSDATSIKSGCTVALQANTYMYMYGGEIIGGTATYLYTESTGKYSNGLGGSLYLAGKSKFVLNDGIIRDGYAEAIVTKRDANGQPSTYERGIGGNIFLASGCVFEMNGGTIKNGKAGNFGGNIYMDGTAEFTMNDGKIQGGTITGKGKNGGSVYVSSKSTFTMNGGSITGGSSFNCAGNLYLNGTVTMNGGYIGGGKIYNWTTKKVNASAASRNVFIVNGKFAMYGGTIDGGVQAIDTDATKTETRMVLAGYATITSNTNTNLTISNGGGGVTVIVGTLRDSAKIGVTTSVGLFTRKTKADNVDNFYSDVEGADIVFYEERIGLGRVNCLCGGEGDGHLAGCDEKQMFWAPWTSTSTLPTTTGNYYLVKDVTCGQQNVAADAIVNLDLNGKTVNGTSGRLYSMHYRVETDNGDGTKTYSYPAHLTITDTSAGRTGTMISHGAAQHQGSIAWLRYGNMTLIAGTFDASDYKLVGSWNAGTDGIYGTADDTASSMSGAAFSVPYGRTLTIYGGTIIGGETVAQEQTKTNTIAVPEGAPEGTEPTTEEVTKTIAAGNGGALDVTGTVYMYGGTIRDGVSGSTGGNIRVNSSGKFYMYGGQILNGTSTGNGGNVQISGLFELHGGTVSGGWSKNVAGNFHVAPGTLTVYGGTVTGGKTGKSGTATSDHANVYVVNGKLNLHGGKIEGYARVINFNTNGAEKGSVVTISGNPVVAGGNTNLVLAPQRDNTNVTPTMPILQVVGPMTRDANIQLSQATVDLDFAAGNGYTVTDADGKAFYINGTDVTAIADTENNTLFFGRYGCLCGKEAHTLGCQQLCGGKDLKWRAWPNTTTLPTSGNWYLIRDLSGSGGSHTVTSGTTLNLDLNGKTVTWKWRVYRIYDASAVSGAILTITNTAENVGTIEAAEHSGQDQGSIVWVASGEKGTFNLLDGVVLDASKYTISNVPSESNGAGTTTEKNGGAVAIQSGGTFNMYGGTIIGANAIRSAEITLSNGNTYSAYAPNGAAVAITSATANMYGGEITGGRTVNQGGNLLISGTKFYMSGGVISDGYATSNGGNVFVHRSAELHMSGDARIENGTSAGHSGNINLDGKMTMTDNATVSGGKATGAAGNININTITSGGKTYYGQLTMSGKASVINGEAGTTSGNIRILKGASMTMTDETVVSGGVAKGGNGGNIYVTDNDASLTLSGKASVIGGSATGNGGNIALYGTSTLDASGDVVISGGSVCGSKGTEVTGGNIIVGGSGAVATLSGNVKVLDGVSYHTGGNIRVSSGATLIVKDNVLISGGKSSNSKSDTATNANATNANANIFCVNGCLELYGGTVDGGINVIGTKENGCTIKLAGNPVITANGGGNGLFSSTTTASVAPALIQVVGPMTGEPGSIVIGISTRVGVIGYGSDYTLTDADAAVFASDQNGAAADCLILRDENNLIVGKGSCLCGQETHTKACQDLWGGEARIWIAWTSTTSLPTTTGNYYLTANVDYDYQQKIAKDANVVLDLNGYTVTNDNGQRMYSNWESGSSLTITDKSAGQTGKLVASGTAVDPGVVWVRYGTFNLVAGTIDASGYNLKNVWSNNAVAEKNGGAIRVDSGTTFNMYGGTVIGANGIETTVTVDGEEKSVYAPNGATIASYGTTNIYDGIIRDGKTVGEAGNIYVGSGTFTMQGGQILDGSAVNGGNVRIGVNGTMTVKEGAVVSGGEATTGRGGNFQVQGILNIEGATVKDSVSGGNGGNIYIAGTGTVNLKSGTVSGGWGKNVSGNFHVDGGKLVVSGGTITGGKVGTSAKTTASDANINSVNGNLEISGGTIDGGILIQNYNVALTTYPTTKLSGAPVINGFINISHTDGKDQPLLEIAEDYTGSLKVYVKSEGILTTGPVTEAQAAKITTTNSGKGVYRLTEAMGAAAEDVHKLYVGVVHCVCGASLNGGEHDADVCDGTLHIWKPTSKIIDSDDLGADQYYYLTQEVKVTGTTTLWGSQHNVTYDLNGFDIVNTGGRIFSTYSSSGDCKLTMTFTITNTGDAATIKVSGSGDEGRVAWLRGSQKKLVIYNVGIDISGATNYDSHTTSKNGMAVAVSGWSNTVNLYNVQVVGGTSASNGNFLAVSGYNNKAALKDSTVTGSSTDQTKFDFGGNGGAFYVGSQAQLTLDNTEVTGNLAKNNGGGVYVASGGKLILSGDTKITGNTVGGAENNVYVEEGGTIETGTLGSNAQVGLSAATGVILSSDVSYAEMDAAFQADNTTTQQLVCMDDGLSLQDASAHIHCVCGGTIASGTELPDGTTHICVDIVYTAMNKTSGNIGDNVNWYLADDVTLVGQLTTQNYVMNLCLNGHNIMQSNTARMIRTFCSTASTTDDNRIVLTSCQPDILVDGKATNNSIIKKAGTFSDDTDGGIFWLTSTGTLEMYAGNLDASGLILKPNASDSPKHGTAIKIESGSTFKMYGGTIYGGETQKGTSNNSEGACIFSTGNIIINGGKIVGGKTVGSGGSLFLYTGSVTKIYGGTITGGEATNNGGNIFFQGKELLIAGGTIEKGTAGTRGGNVYFAVAGGTISGGNIKSGNAADGGNLANGVDISFDLTGGTVDGGNATSAGGNVWLMGPMNMSGGHITNGTKSGNKQQTGANMNMNDTGVLNISGGHIEGRVCAAVAGAKVNISGSAKIHGTDQTNNLYVGNMTITIGKLNADAKIGLLILNESQIGTVATIESGVTIDPAQFPVQDLELTNSSTRSFAAKQDGTNLVIYEITE